MWEDKEEGIDNRISSHETVYTACNKGKKIAQSNKDNSRIVTAMEIIQLLPKHLKCFSGKYFKYIIIDHDDIKQLISS